MHPNHAGRDWLELVAELLQRPLTSLPEREVAHQLRETFEARAVGFSERARDRPTEHRLWPADERFDGHREEVLRWSRTESPRAHPILRYYLATTDWAPIQVRDIPDPFAGRRIKDAFHELGTSWGTPTHVAVPVHFDPGTFRAFVIGRVDPLTPAEMDLLRMLHRLLGGLDRQVAALGRIAPDPVTREHAQALNLTARELTVLGLTADGLTAVAAGRRLAIAPRTVHKHLERAYRKLGVGDRLGAVVRAQQLGLLESRLLRAE